MEFKVFNQYLTCCTHCILNFNVNMKKIKITEVLIMSLKKKIAGVLLATMCTAFFAGCGGDNKSADSTSGKKVQIEYWHVASESFGGQTVKELVKDFNEKHPDIEVVEKYNPDMYKGLTQNLQAAIASGKNPDVVQMAGPTLTMLPKT